MVKAGNSFSLRTFHRPMAWVWNYSSSKIIRPTGDSEISINTVFKTGLSHFCIQNPDVEAMVQQIVDAGGKQTMPPTDMYPGEKPYKMAFTEDPFGNMIEIYSHSYELQNVRPDGVIS